MYTKKVNIGRAGPGPREKRETAQVPKITGGGGGGGYPLPLIRKKPGHPPPFKYKKRAIRIFQNNPNISHSRRRFHAK
ncbi:hypothetical protein Mboo_0577 [Methanoregula boonei 6A8]|uniref:Uncharacterized protein n=1 Tax=Methanoregula boonei (strain DSM 21154 / JCM 14090 / 6A8) TaxID=456442 RepID=A7I5T4_METB6|nr:hypothetical protein Mboo_0577 [Methanoregula boonei 6A8]